MDNYSAYVREFRQLILEKSQCNNNIHDSKIYLKKIFTMIDQNQDGVITINELRQFIQALDIQLSPINKSNDDDSTTSDSHVDTTSFCEILIHQIDLDNNGKISYNELMEFLWPKEISQREIGAVIQKIRSALLASIKGKSKKLTTLSDNALIDLFAKLTNVSLLRGNLIEVRALRKAFSKLHNPVLGTMSSYEVEILVTSLDTNCDGVVSAREFRKWLLREEEEIEFPSNPLDDMEFLPNDSEFVSSILPPPPLPPWNGLANECQSPPNNTLEEEFENLEGGPTPETNPRESFHDDNHNEPYLETTLNYAPPPPPKPELGQIPLMTPSIISRGEEKKSAPPPSLLSLATPPLPTYTQNISSPFPAPALVNTSNLNQRKSKSQFGNDLTSSRTDQKSRETKDQNSSSMTSSSPPASFPSPSSPSSSADLPNENQRLSTFRWIAFLGLGVLVVYVVYRGMASSSSSSSSPSDKME